MRAGCLPVVIDSDRLGFGHWVCVCVSVVCVSLNANVQFRDPASSVLVPSAKTGGAGECAALRLRAKKAKWEEGRGVGRAERH